MRNEDYPDPTPTPVIWSVALGVAPLPFLAVYSVLFISHGFVYPVNPPDITTTQTGEGVAGIVTSVLFILGVWFLWWYLNGKRRWPFVIGQLATFATSVYFILDRTTGSMAVPILLVLTSGTALVLSALPSGWAHTGFQPASRRRTARPVAPATPVAPRRRTGEPVDALFDPSDADPAMSELTTR